MLAIALMGKLAGVRGMALGEFAGCLTQTRLAAVQAFRSPRSGRLEPPSASSFYRILSSPATNTTRASAADVSPAT